MAKQSSQFIFIFLLSHLFQGPNIEARTSFRNSFFRPFSFNSPSFSRRGGSFSSFRNSRSPQNFRLSPGISQFNSQGFRPPIFTGNRVQEPASAFSPSPFSQSPSERLVRGVSPRNEAPSSKDTGVVAGSRGLVAPPSDEERDVVIGKNGNLGLSFQTEVATATGLHFHGCQGTLVSVTPSLGSESGPFVCSVLTASHCLEAAYKASSVKTQEANALVGRATFTSTDFGRIQNAKIFLHPSVLPNKAPRESNDAGLVTFPCKGDKKPVPIRTTLPSHNETVRYATRMNGIGMSPGEYLEHDDGKRFVGQLFATRTNGIPTTQGDSGGGVFDLQGNIMGTLLGGTHGRAQIYSKLMWAKKVLQDLGMELPALNGIERGEGTFAHNQPGEFRGHTSNLRHSGDQETRPVASR